MEELRAYHAPHSSLLQRREQHQWAAKYLHGLLLGLTRESSEPMVQPLEGPNPKAVRTLRLPSKEGPSKARCSCTAIGKKWPNSWGKTLVSCSWMAATF